MGKAQRHDAILRQLEKNSSVSVEELIAMFAVSRETIRNDLIQLEMDGRLRRTFGGAIEVPQRQMKFRSEIPYYERESVNKVAKQEIAQVALRYIHENDHIILDSSSTCVYLARALPNRPLSVLTNSIRIVTELALKDRIDVSCTGGLLLRSSMCMVGNISGKNFNQHNVDSAFFSCGGVTESGTTESHELAVMAKNEMSRAADKAYLLVDHTKFGRKDFVHIAALSAYAMIITDSQITPEQIRSLGYPPSRIISAAPLR